MPTRGKLYRLEGIVLSRRDYGEADRIIAMLTPAERVDLLAKGVRKPRSRKTGHLELFCKTQVLVSRVKNSWDIISQAEAITVRQTLLSDFECGTYGRYVCELVLRFFEAETDAVLYNLLDQTLSLLETGHDPERVVRWYEPRLLTLAGFRPEWGMCVGLRDAKLCQRALHPSPKDNRPYGVDPERGGALCPDCFIADRDMPAVRPLSPGALSWLQAFQRREYEEFVDLSFSKSRAAELARVMEHYIAYHLENRPAALRVLGRGTT